MKNIVKINYMECSQIKEIKMSSGFFDKPNYSDKIVLAHFWEDYSKELKKEISFIDSLRDIENWLEEDCFYVWREKNGKIVCMANYWENKDIAHISYVYTAKENRNKGYCKSLVHELTKLLLNKKKIPILYADNENKPALIAYQEVGFEKKELLYRITVSNEKNSN